MTDCNCGGIVEPQAEENRRNETEPDLWIYLPPELLVLVFSSLDVFSVVAGMGTCRLWRATLQNSQSLWYKQVTKTHSNDTYNSFSSLLYFLKLLLSASSTPDLTLLALSVILSSSTFSQLLCATSLVHPLSDLQYWPMTIKGESYAGA